jgi:hypothetical protein
MGPDPPRRFTVAEANDALVEVRPLVERMVTAKRALDEAQERRDEAARSIAGNGGGIQPRELARLNDEVQRRATALADVVAEIQGLGVLVKDLDTGLVDFPTIRAGEEVLLCWQLGEAEIAYWHRPEDGFAGRQPL